MELFCLSPKTKLLWRVQSVLATLFLCVSGVLLFSGVFGVVWALSVLIVSTLFNVIYVPMVFRKRKTLLNKGTIIIKRGILFKFVTFIPISRILYVKTVSTPMMCLLNMEIMIFKTAGASFYMPPVDKLVSGRIVQIIENEKNNV